MGVEFSDDFDDEVEGTTPPVNFVFDGAVPLDNLEVDDAHFHSSPHGMYCNKTAAAWASGHHDISYSSGEKIGVWTYFENTNTHRAIQLQSTAGNYNAATIVGSMHFRNDTTIRAFDGAVFTDTGFNYVSGSQKKCEWQFDFGANTWDAWYDGDLIINDWGFRVGAVGSIESIQFACYAARFWVDDVVFGDTSLFAVSPAQAGPMSGGVTI